MEEVWLSLKDCSAGPDIDRNLGKEMYMQAEAKNNDEFPNVNIALDLEETTADRIREIEALQGKKQMLCNFETRKLPLAVLLLRANFFKSYLLQYFRIVQAHTYCCTWEATFHG